MTSQLGATYIQEFNRKLVILCDQNNQAYIYIYNRENLKLIKKTKLNFSQ